MWKQFVGVLLLCFLLVATVLGGVVGYSWVKARSQAIVEPDRATFQTLPLEALVGMGAGPGGSKKSQKDIDAPKNDKDRAKTSGKDSTPQKPDDTKSAVQKPASTGTTTPDKEKKDQPADKKDKPAEKKDQPTKEGAVKPPEAAKDAGKTEPVKPPEKNSVPPAAEKSDPKPADPAAKKPPEENKKPS